MRDVFNHLGWAVGHRLTQVALAYAATAFLLHRAVWVIRIVWRLPDWLDQTALVTLAIGFLPVMLMAAWPASVGADEVGDRVDVELRNVAGAGHRIVAPARQDH